ncbi:TIGR02266 family protein [Aggregicoccus sp. 17bor-14]|uniref:TIGR02266 family protein n=1 Tax=Myxococcaceae TaxID=31 RepID=UPI00129C8216|nr:MULTISPECIES: TIGR02266 family protein [Myxococcaceae]MBF5042120.1 TIGR02266 family protein [Simulacricoccus sp. 17bor-14]MRI87897.1 TIGR02266 family protein [Aggregicoccus sp. 17bor-14]
MSGIGKPQGYWIGDSSGRVLGPLSLQALRDLVASGRLKGASRASRDGSAWEPLPEFAEVRDLVQAPKPNAAFELAQAERVRTQLRALRDANAYDTFGVKPGASLDELRGAFFRLAKRYQPDRLPPDAHAELRSANAEMFDLLSRRMREAEQRAGGAPQAMPPASRPSLTPVPGSLPTVSRPSLTPVPGSLPTVSRPPGSTPVPGSLPTVPRPPGATPVPGSLPTVPRAAAPAGAAARGATPPPRSTPTPAPRAPAAPAPFTYDASEFVGLQRRGEERLHADIRCTTQSVGIFTDHRVVNISSGGIFIATPTPLRLGTKLNVTLHFEEPPGKMELLGTVVWEHTLEDGRQPRGYGVRLDARAAERKVLEEFVRKHRKDQDQEKK